MKHIMIGMQNIIRKMEGEKCQIEREVGARFANSYTVIWIL